MTPHLDGLQLAAQKLPVGRSWKIGCGVGRLEVVDQGAIEAEGYLRDKKRSQSLTFTSKIYSRVSLRQKMYISVTGKHKARDGEWLACPKSL